PMPRTTRHWRIPLALLAAALFAATAACQQSPTTARGATASVADPRVVLNTGPTGLVDWSAPLVLSVADGELRSASVMDPLAYPVEGRLGDGHWTSTTELVPDTAYLVTASVEDTASRARTISITAHTSKATKLLRATHSPRGDRVVGVGLPAIITLSRSLTDASDRAAVVSRLRVETEPHVDGAWRWMNDKELHYRPATYWAKGTQINVHSDLTALRLSHGVWGSGSVDTQFSVGSAVVATVDVEKKAMTVVVDGKLIRTVKVSTGRDKYPTRGGVHLVLEKLKVQIMDSATVGIPRKSPDGYYEEVPDSVRISYGGAFVHSASWSVRDQGVRNVSHGCVNISPADARWFFELVKRGDVVNIVHAKAPPLLTDPGMSDWNVPFSEWPNS
ncbi:MAG: Ig-like domain-containing protein, partial [Actinomycetota bacterium]|nr:Ig-like domain-containing protein [Actinomycetota bacterium]